MLKINLNHFEFPSIWARQVLRVISSWGAYIEHIKPYRQKDKKDELGCVKQHKKFLKSTISGWVKKIPKQPRINVEYFKSDSTKSNSISKAALFNNFEKLIFLNVSQKINTIIDK